MEELIEKMKEKVAFEASRLINSNMNVGLGTGTTVRYLVNHLSKKLREKTIQNVNIVCSSLETERLCSINKIPFISVEKVNQLDTYIDGADEITKSGFAFKGLGGALTREKILRKSCKEFVVIITSNKLVQSLGQKSPLPVEIIQFGYSKTISKIKSLNIEGLHIKEIRLRKSKTSEIFLSDNSNYIADIFLSKPISPQYNRLEFINKSIKYLTGVIETGLFTNPANSILIGEVSDMSIRTINVRNN
ncbi:MAG: ribose 5-phosphate isomerase A [Candidatus Kariarchaeaceae archaeon]|jgi:ribose 5-phosphate isomerase A